MRMVWLIEAGLLRIELAMRGPKPALGNRRVRIKGALEHHLAQVRREQADDEEQIGIDRFRGDEQLRRKRSRDFDILRFDRKQKGHAVAEARITVRGLRLRLLGPKREVVAIEKQRAPFGSSERPFPLATRLETIEMTHPEANRRLRIPTIRLSFQKMIEKALLKANAIVRIELGPMLPAMDFEPLLR